MDIKYFYTPHRIIKYTLLTTQAQVDEFYEAHPCLPKVDITTVDAATHSNTSGGAPGIAAVLIDLSAPDMTLQLSAELIAHEAVHVWQAHIEMMEEHHPGDEQEAYCVQEVFSCLMSGVWEQFGINLATKRNAIV